jgi:hypothetical protein
MYEILRATSILYDAPCIKRCDALEAEDASTWSHCDSENIANDQ